MATTRLIPLHVGEGRSAGTAIRDIIEYVENPDKTDGFQLVTGYQCDSRSADMEFMFAKKLYEQKTGRVRGRDNVIAYHLRQSFAPGEITPEEANRLGRELAKRFTKGRHAFVVATHIDKHHIHNHIRVITTKCGLANGLGEREGDCRSGGIWLRSDCQYSETRKPSELPA